MLVLKGQIRDVEPDFGGGRSSGSGWWAWFERCTKDNHDVQVGQMALPETGMVAMDALDETQGI